MNFDCIELTAVSLIQESYAEDWDTYNIDTEFDTNELFCGFDDLSEIDLPSTSNLEELQQQLPESNTEPIKLEPAKKSTKRTKSATLKYCDYCEFSSPSSFNLNRHTIRAHLNIYSFPCEVCGQHFKDSDTLNQHKSQVHLPTHQSKFLCPECEKTFKRKHDQQRHISMVHSRQKAFFCPYCAGKFTSSSNCQRHIKNRCELRPLNDRSRIGL